MNLDAEYREYREYIEEFAKTIDPVSTKIKLLYPKYTKKKYQHFFFFVLA